MGNEREQGIQDTLFFPDPIVESSNHTAPTYSQPTLEGLETEAKTEVLLENCVVAARPIYKKVGSGHEWQCSLYALPDIFHQDRDELVEAHATNYAEMANKKRLRPGDRVVLKGLLSQQELALENGETRTVNYIRVSDIAVIEKAERKSITVFEQKRSM
jgi:hypothetical protein